MCRVGRAADRSRPVAIAGSWNGLIVRVSLRRGECAGRERGGHEMFAEQLKVARAAACPLQLPFAEVEYDASALTTASATADTRFDPSGTHVQKFHLTAVRELATQASIGGPGEVIKNLEGESVDERQHAASVAECGPPASATPMTGVLPTLASVAPDGAHVAP